MQFNRYLTYRKSSSVIHYWPWVLKIGLAAGAFYYVASKLWAEQVYLNKVAALFATSEFAALCLIITTLMSLNWLLESKKWQLLAKQVQPISIGQAFKAILTGVLFDTIMPFGVGAVSSKVLSLTQGNRSLVVGPVIMAQGVQSLWTVLFGLVGLVQLAKMTTIGAIYGKQTNLLVLLVLFAALILIAIKFWPQKAKNYVDAIKKVSNIIWLKIIGLSFLRYIIFLVQLMLLALYLAPQIPWVVLLGCITWMFFAKTIVPKPGHLGALGIRGASVIFFLSLAGYPSAGIVLATLILWVINLAIPSLAGLFFIKNLSLNPEVSND